MDGGRISSELTLDLERKEETKGYRASKAILKDLGIRTLAAGSQDPCMRRVL